ncbi:MAG: nucleotidyltransferase domain-containing protein [Pseudomonadota bacterium]|nr:nucleotidyltransferase domain-containing protein [Pseudomonadota bacterium]
MRLTDTQIRIIKARAAECFGSNAHVWLFGFRVDDDARGGDIDLYVELSEPVDDDAWRALRFNGALQQAFGPQRIDVITRSPSEPLKPIHETANRTGVAL